MLAGTAMLTGHAAAAGSSVGDATAMLTEAGAGTGCAAASGAGGAGRQGVSAGGVTPAPGMLAGTGAGAGPGRGPSLSAPPSSSVACGGWLAVLSRLFESLLVMQAPPGLPPLVLHRASVPVPTSTPCRVTCPPGGDTRADASAATAPSAAGPPEGQPATAATAAPACQGVQGCTEAWVEAWSALMRCVGGAAGGPPLQHALQPMTHKVSGRVAACGP